MHLKGQFTLPEMPCCKQPPHCGRNAQPGVKGESLAVPSSRVTLCPGAPAGAGAALTAHEAAGGSCRPSPSRAASPDESARDAAGGRSRGAGGPGEGC